MAYVIDTYNRFDQWDRAHAVKVFEINDVQYAVKEVELEWGLPKFPLRIDEEWRHNLEYLKLIKVYEKLEDALKFVQIMRGLN